MMFLINLKMNWNFCFAPKGSDKFPKNSNKFSPIFFL